jgi:hypothetical protein
LTRFVKRAVLPRASHHLAEDCDPLPYLAASPALAPFHTAVEDTHGLTKQQNPDGYIRVVATSAHFLLPALKQGPIRDLPDQLPLAAVYCLAAAGENAGKDSARRPARRSRRSHCAFSHRNQAHRCPCLNLAHSAARHHARDLFLCPVGHMNSIL